MTSGEDKVTQTDHRHIRGFIMNDKEKAAQGMLAHLVQLVERKSLKSNKESLLRQIAHRWTTQMPDVNGSAEPLKGLQQGLKKNIKLAVKNIITRLVLGF